MSQIYSNRKNNKDKRSAQEAIAKRKKNKGKNIIKLDQRKEKIPETANTNAMTLISIDRDRASINKKSIVDKKIINKETVIMSNKGTVVTGIIRNIGTRTESIRRSTKRIEKDQMRDRNIRIPNGTELINYKNVFV